LLEGELLDLLLFLGAGHREISLVWPSYSSGKLVCQVVHNRRLDVDENSLREIQRCGARIALALLALYRLLEVMATYRFEKTDAPTCCSVALVVFSCARPNCQSHSFVLRISLRRKPK
jgi:hypothetical protein